MLKPSNIKSKKNITYNDRMSIYAVAKAEEENVSGKKLVTMQISDILEDPDNKRIYGDYNSSGLSEAIEKDGFTEPIIVYPYDGKYMIQSGHRRLSAALSAGLSEVSVIVVEAPKSNSERIRRLIASNLHERSITPLIIAREAKELNEVHREELALLGPIMERDVMALTAQDLEISSSHLSKYLGLLELIPELQELANSEDVSWSTLSSAKKLTEYQQKMLAKWISVQNKISPITRAELLDKIEYLNNACFSEDAQKRDERSKDLLSGIWANTESDSDSTETATEEKSKRINGSIRIRKSSDLLRESLLPNARFKKREIPGIIKELNSMKELIDEKLKQLDELSKEGRG